MFRIAKFNLVKQIKNKQVVSLRLSSSESAKNALENREAPKTPANTTDGINQTPQQSNLFKFFILVFKIIVFQ